MTYLRPKKEYFTPATGGTVTLVNASTDIRAIIAPAGTLATLTIQMPPNPFDAQVVSICSSQAVTILTMTASIGLLGALTSFVANSFASYAYDSTSNAWYRAS